MLAERCGQAGQRASAAGRAVLAFEPAHGGKTYPSLSGKLVLREAMLAAKFPKPLAVEDGDPPLSANRGRCSESGMPGAGH